MQIQNINSQYITRNSNTRASNKNLNFGTIATAGNIFLRFLETNQAVGANSVDFVFGVVPRTSYDSCKRGKDAGLETARREFLGLANNSLIGSFGMLGGLILTPFFNKKFSGIKPNNLLVDNATIDILAEKWNETIKNNSSEPVKDYLKKVIDDIKVFNPQIEGNKDGWIKIPQNIQNDIVEKLDNLVKSNKQPKTVSDTVAYIKNLIISSTGSERIMIKAGDKSATGSINTIFENIHNLSKMFDKSEIKNIFKTTTNIAQNAFVKAVKSMNLNRMLIGLGLGTAIGVSAQPLNKYLTYKKTGQKGFVGVPGRKEDTSTGFKILKGVSGLAFSLFALATITNNPKKLMSKLQFNGYLPTLNQFKFVYGLTIASRFLAARDKDELRESAIKDTLSFLNLLILGAFVTKGVARIFNKSKSLFHTLPDGVKGGGFWGSKLKTRDEVLLSVLNKNDISAVKDGKALKYGDLLKLKDRLPAEELKKLNKDLRLLTLSQLTGYLYTGLVLGLGVPALNKHMTAKSEAKYKAKFEAEQTKILKNNTRIVENSAFMQNGKNSVWKKFIK